MFTRRRALAILGAAGIGTGVFQGALAAKAAERPITPRMVADAEWVAGIKLTPAQREAAANHLNKYRESTIRIRAIELDNSHRPGLVFAPLSSPASRPDPRGYQVVASPKPVSREVARPNSDEDLAFASIASPRRHPRGGVRSNCKPSLDKLLATSRCRPVWR
jgi:hypothetical protein